jgi:hypothetical protein
VIKPITVFGLSLAGIFGLSAVSIVTDFTMTIEERQPFDNFSAIAWIPLVLLMAYSQMRSGHHPAPPLFTLGAPGRKKTLALAAPGFDHLKRYWDAADEEIYQKARAMGVSHSHALQWAYLSHQTPVDFHEVLEVAQAVLDNGGDPIRYAQARVNGVNDPQLAVLVSSNKLALDLAEVMQER